MHLIVTEESQIPQSTLCLLFSILKPSAILKFSFSAFQSLVFLVLMIFATPIRTGLAKCYSKIRTGSKNAYPNCHFQRCHFPCFFQDFLVYSDFHFKTQSFLMSLLYFSTYIITACVLLQQCCQYIVLHPAVAQFVT